MHSFTSFEKIANELIWGSDEIHLIFANASVSMETVLVTGFGGLFAGAVR